MIVIQKFSSIGCIPCKGLQKERTEFLEETNYDVLVEEYDVAANRDFAIANGIRSVPTMIVRDHDGRVLQTIVGFRKKEELQEILAEVLGRKE